MTCLDFIIAVDGMTSTFPDDLFGAADSTLQFNGVTDGDQRSENFDFVILLVTVRKSWKN